MHSSQQMLAVECFRGSDLTPPASVAEFESVRRLAALYPMNNTHDSTIDSAWLRFALIVLVSTGSYFWVRHYSQVFDSSWRHT